MDMHTTDMNILNVHMGQTKDTQMNLINTGGLAYL
jgi:hypothetical protein